MNKFPRNRNLVAFDYSVLAYTNFGVLSSIPTRWLHSAAWDVSNGKLVMNNPTLGSELFVNGDFSAGDTGWTVGANWTIGSGVASKTAGANNGIAQSVASSGKWYRTSVDVLSISGSTFYTGIGASAGGTISTPGSYVHTRLAFGTGSYLGGGIAAVGSVDNLSFKELSIADLLIAQATGEKDVKILATVSQSTGAQVGCVGWLDSYSSPSNFILCYLDVGVLKIDKCVAGAYTNLVSTAVTYSANAAVELWGYRSGGDLKVQAKYKGANVGAEQTISNAGIVDNVQHGAFSTYSGNGISSVSIARYS